MKYRTIVADPPWPYENREAGGFDAIPKSLVKDGSRLQRSVREMGYQPMPMAEILGLRPPATDDAHLYLWTTNAFMDEAGDVARAWGFTPKTILTYGKIQPDLLRPRGASLSRPLPRAVRPPSASRLGHVGGRGAQPHRARGGRMTRAEQEWDTWFRALPRFGQADPYPELTLFPPDAYRKLPSCRAGERRAVTSPSSSPARLSSSTHGRMRSVTARYRGG